MNVFVKLMFTAMLSFLFAEGFMIFFQRSEHAIFWLFLVLAFSPFLLMAFIMKKKESLVYAAVLSFPALEMKFPNTSIMACVLLPVGFVYWNDITGYCRKNWNWHFALPLIVFLSVFAYTTMAAPFMGAALRHASFFLPAIVLFWLLSVHMKTMEEFQKVWACLIVIFLLCAFVSAYQAVFGINSIKLFNFNYNPNTEMYGAGRRIPSIFSDAQAGGHFFAVMALALSGYAALKVRGSRLAAILAVVAIPCLLLTISRMATMGFLFGWIFIKLFSKAQRIALFLIFLSAVLLMFKEPILENIPNAISKRFDLVQQRQDADYRWQLWVDGWPIFVHYPLYGAGLGGLNLFQAGDAVGVRFPDMLQQNIEYRRYTHFENSYLDLLYSLGILGLGSFLLLIAAFFRQAILSLRRITPASGYAAVCLLGAVVASLECCFTSPLLSQSHTSMILAVLLSSICFLVRDTQNV